MLILLPLQFARQQVVCCWFQVPLLELLRLLVEAGAEVTAQDDPGQTPLQVALIKGNTLCAGFLALRK
jgi:ankyrin repeat protein